MKQLIDLKTVLALIVIGSNLASCAKKSNSIKTVSTPNSLQKTNLLPQVSTDSLDGTWTLSERLCSDGTPGHDAFQPNQDSMETTISGDHAVSILTIAGKTFTYSSTINWSTKNIIAATDADGKEQKNLYTLSKDNELVIISTGFKRGGTCDEGQALMMILKKK